jgi:hypothetical protein
VNNVDSPSRSFSLVVDPGCLPLVADFERGDVRSLIRDLATHEPPVTVTLIIPSDLGSAATNEYVSALRVPTTVCGQFNQTQPLALDTRIKRKDQERFKARKAEVSPSLQLLGLAVETRADAIVTERADVIAARYSLAQYHRVRVLRVGELADFVEVCAHGHSIFWSASGVTRRAHGDVYYMFANPENVRLTGWMWKAWDELKAAGVEEEWRSAILNRYGFLLYTRDMIRFYEIQMQYFERRGVKRRFSQPLGYYVANFYLHLWGMLEHLTLIARKVLSLEIDERACGIENRTFWRAAGRRQPGLSKEIRGRKIGDWIGIMADMRHPAAHRAMLLPSDLVRESPDSRKSDDEIREILLKEDPDYYEGMRPEVREVLEKERIRLWRMDRLETIGSNLIVVKKEAAGTYFRFPVTSVDYDLDMLTRTMDVFIQSLFPMSRAT